MAQSLWNSVQGLPENFAAASALFHQARFEIKLLIRVKSNAFMSRTLLIFPARFVAEGLALLSPVLGHLCATLDRCS